MFSLIISDIIERFTEADTVIMGDVSYERFCQKYYINQPSNAKRQFDFFFKRSFYDRELRTHKT